MVRTSATRLSRLGLEPFAGDVGGQLIFAAHGPDTPLVDAQIGESGRFRGVTVSLRNIGDFLACLVHDHPFCATERMTGIIVWRMAKPFGPLLDQTGKMLASDRLGMPPLFAAGE